MAEVSVNVHPYSDHLHLELIMDGGGGNVSVETIELDIVDADRAIVAARDEVPAPHEPAVRSRLADAGYDLVEKRPA